MSFSTTTFTCEEARLLAAEWRRRMQHLINMRRDSFDDDFVFPADPYEECEEDEDFLTKAAAITNPQWHVKLQEVVAMRPRLKAGVGLRG